MKAFFLLFAAFLSATVTLTNAAALPQDAVSHRTSTGPLSVTIHDLHGPEIGNSLSVSGTAIEARAGEEGDEQNAGPSNSTTKRKHPGSPPDAPAVVADFIEQIHNLARKVKEDKTQGKMPQRLDDEYATRHIMNLMGVDSVEDSKKTGDSKGSEGGSGGKGSPTRRHSSFSSTCRGSVSGEGGTSDVGEDDATDLSSRLSDLKHLESSVITRLVQKEGVPPHLMHIICLGFSESRSRLIEKHKQRDSESNSEQEMEPAGKRQKKYE
ncbi:hypothetical protein H0H93_006910 [Arthromyces matolae]|nr:hypothetical protein H0H93_006910 [Arthromyces matolae]